MKNNNLLITVAVIFIAIAGIGWFVTSQGASSTAQQDQLITTPLVNKTTKTSPVETTSRQTDYNGNHHRNNGQHCYDEQID